MGRAITGSGPSSLKDGITKCVKENGGTVK